MIPNPSMLTNCSSFGTLMEEMAGDHKTNYSI